MLVDAHCHLLDDHLEGGGLDRVFERAHTQGVTGFIAVGTELSEVDPLLAIARKRVDVRLALGIHPHEASLWNPEIRDAFVEPWRDPMVLFVGETGLDWHYDLSPRDVQERAFREQICLARQVGKPLMIHTRSAGAETLRILDEEKAQNVGGIIHCFSEDRAFASKALDLGFYLSFSGIVTFPRHTEAIRETAAWAPWDRILVETDSPFLAPVPHRGQRNEPAYLIHIAQTIAHLRGVSLAELAQRTTANLEALCGWRPVS